MSDAPNSSAAPAQLDPTQYEFPAEKVEAVESWRTYDTFSNLIAMPDSPFSDYGGNRNFDRDGKKWVRMSQGRKNRFVDIELKPDGYMGEVRAVPMAEAYEEARSRGWKT